jgi:hypothetical protein
MMIARRADTRARADFATWKMIAKLNGASSLSVEATIHLMYKSYYAEMGGVGLPPEVRTGPSEPVTDNVTAFRRPPPAEPKRPAAASSAKQLPVALIFACLVVVYVGIRYFWR